MKNQIKYNHTMKKSFITTIFMLWTMFMMAQSQQIHVVKRGETFASIASKYGMTESELRNVNPNVKNCFAGTKLNLRKSTDDVPKVRIVQNKSIVTNNETTIQDKVVPSVLSSNTVQSESKSVSNPIDRYLSLSKSEINHKKYRKATKWINIVLNDGRSTAEQKKEAQRQLAQIENAKEERRERLSAFFDNLETGLKKTEQSLRAMSEKAYEIDAMQKGTNVTYRTPAATFNNSSSQIVNDGINKMKKYTEETIAKSEKEFAEWNEKRKKEKEERDRIYNNGLNCYNEGNYSEALKWFKQAAENGNIEAQYKVGDMYAEGKGVEKNETIAMRWYKQAEENQRYLHNSILQSENKHSQSSTPTIISEPTIRNEKRRVEKPCTWCNGTGMQLSNTTCYYHFGAVENCIERPCNTCGKTHCIHMTSHKHCSICDGTGKRVSYEYE